MITQPQLQALVDRRLSLREIAGEIGCSPTTVRWWLRRYGMKTDPARYWRRDRPKPDEITRECRVHGPTRFRLVGASYRCVRCGTGRVARRRRRLKEILLAEAGGACRLCGYDRCAAALQFHHLDPTEKAFGFAAGGLTRSIAVLREEAKKCVLLCANCHAEVEMGLVEADTLRRSSLGPG